MWVLVSNIYHYKKVVSSSVCGTWYQSSLVVSLNRASFLQFPSLLKALLRRSGVSICSPGLCVGMRSMSHSEHNAQVSRSTSVITVHADLPVSRARTIAELSQFTLTVRPDRFGLAHSQCN